MVQISIATKGTGCHGFCREWCVVMFDGMLITEAVTADVGLCSRPGCCESFWNGDKRNCWIHCWIKTILNKSFCKNEMLNLVLNFGLDCWISCWISGVVFPKRFKTSVFEETQCWISCWISPLGVEFRAGWIVEFRVEFPVLNFQNALKQAFSKKFNVEFRVEFRPWVLNFGLLVFVGNFLVGVHFFWKI